LCGTWLLDFSSESLLPKLNCILNSNHCSCSTWIGLCIHNFFPIKVRKFYPFEFLCWWWHRSF
jgi:hypothetical protein